jgi:tetratricopeptide (TPR) repeat protein
MKKYIYFLFVALLLGACNEDSFLEEKPLDFMSASNSYVTASDFDQAANELYYLTRYEFYSGSFSDYLSGTDELVCGASGCSQPGLSNVYGASYGLSKTHWDNLYSLVAQSNILLNRLTTSSVAADAQVIYQAKARFFRGLGYRTLNYLYGDRGRNLGVPLTLTESTKPKTDYVRATYDEVLDQAIADVKFAAENLKKIDDASLKNGEINSAAAYHLLAELYLTKGEYQNAADAATKVISGECGAVALMTNRFGSRKTETPGDVYWDLFRKNNQNRASSNTEGLFVIQMENLGTAAGGMDITSIWGVNYILERNCAPQTGLFRMSKGGVQYTPFTWPIGDYTGGRGIGSLFPNYHFDKEVWGGLGSQEFKQDIRNANHNFVRKFKFNTTNSTNMAAIKAAFGSDTIDIDKYDDYTAAGWSFISGDNNVTTSFPARYLTCYQTKCTMLYQDYPSALVTNTTTYTLTGTAGGTYNDAYMFRLADTYLLRAEAYARLKQFDKALLDIKTVRDRAKAVPATLEDVSATGVSGVAGLDYILDERMRELGIEEHRRLTLARLGEDVFYNRVLAYNPYYAGSYGSRGMVGEPFSKSFTRYSIPQTAIDANKDAELIQNTGY